MTMDCIMRLKSSRTRVQVLKLPALGLIFLLLWPLSILTQTPGPTDPGIPSSSNPPDPTTIFDHSGDARYWISGQINLIFQAHPSFPEKYSGENSLKSGYEKATSSLMTLYTGVRLDNSTEILFNLESTGGRGLSDALGLAGFTDLDVVRNPDLGSTPYIARLMIHKIISLSPETTEGERGPMSLLTKLPVRRLEIRFGKLGLVDYFDVNSVGSDSHLQFMNWTVDNNGAYDYAADTRGYTEAAMVEFHDRRWSARFAEALMPKVANGINLSLNLARSRSENFEVELDRGLLPGKPGVIRILGYVNHANMGIYREAVHDFLLGLTPVPDITAHPRQSTVKYGFGINVEQSITDNLHLFGRWGWNNGKTESFAYTEVDQTVSGGASLGGNPWHRGRDKLGLALISNAISGDHRSYLALGGKGFVLGDGRLTYGREKIFETYYNVHLWRGAYVGPDFQHINNPGYNRDRGPVFVLSMRLHVDF